LLFPAIGTLLFSVLFGLLLLGRRALGEFQKSHSATRSEPSPVIAITRKRLLIGTTAGIIACVGLYGLRSSNRSWTVSPKVLVFCVDGATWDLIDPLIQSGHLPHLARFREQGASGVLLSSEPTYSPIIWTTMATGLDPDGHGITSFYSTRRNLKAKQVWEILDEQGYSIGIYRWLVTWPATPVRGFLIPDILARDARSYPSRYRFINQLRIDSKTGNPIGIPTLIGYGFRFLQAGLRLDTVLSVAAEHFHAVLQQDSILAFVSTRRAEIRLNRDIYAHLLRETRPDFTTFYDNGVDIFSHYYWKYMEPDFFPSLKAEYNERYLSLIEEYYRLVDETLGSLLDHLDETVSVFILSDHGLTADPEASGHRLYPLGVPILEALGLSDQFYAISVGGRTYIESRSLDLDLRRRALTRAALELSRVTTLDGSPVFNTATGDDMRILLSVSAHLSHPDIEIRSGSRTYNLQDWTSLRPASTGKHDLEGIVLARGPGIQGGGRISGAKIADVAPTLLYTMGMPVSREFRGVVLIEAFTEEFRRRNSVSWIDTYRPLTPLAEEIEVDQMTREELRALGYVR
ncbi:MAG: alkaline phosphatase family protein, partial [Acidobacteriota bacterium]